MARTRKTIKAKEPVKIRYKEIANGNKSVYLDIYSNGARRYEFLKLYIVPERTQADKVANENTMQVANAIKAQRILELASGKAGINDNGKGKILFVDWLNEYKRIKEISKRYGDTITATVKYVEEYRHGNVRINQIDKQWLVDFFQWLDTCKNKKREPLSGNTKYTLSAIINGALNAAMQKDIIPSNPMLKLSRDEKPHQEDSKRAFLTVEELKKMIQGRCRNEQVKRAFLFACFCGLRYGDIEMLNWGQIYQDGEQSRLTKTMQKTKREIYLPLSEQALRWLPDRGAAKDTDKVFELPHKTNVERAVDSWAFASGIEKHVTFHVSRHTFATLSLTAGVDLYTTSKLLGHTNVKTTQIYAKIIDKKKDEAVNLVSKLFD